MQLLDVFHRNAGAMKVGRVAARYVVSKIFSVPDVLLAVLQRALQ